MTDSNEASKIIVDDDWKAQARAEKAKLAAERKQAAEAAAAEQANKNAAASADQSASPADAPSPATPASPAGEQGEARKLPEANFNTIVTTMATQALFAMGAAPDPRTGQRYLDLDMARFQIDCLAALQVKTEGNLDEDETRQLRNTLYELRSHFISVTRQMTAQGLAGSGQV